MSYYRQTRRQTVGATTGQHLARIAATLEAAGATIPQQIQQATENTWASLEQLKELRAEANPQSYVRSIEEKMAEGKATVSDLMGAANARTAVDPNPGSPLATMFGNAETLISRRTHRVFREHGNKWITETLRPLVDGYVETILDAAPETLRVDPRQDSRQLDFLHHIPAVAQAWGSLTTIYGAVRRLRGLAVIPSTLQRDDCYEYQGDPAERDSMQDSNITWFVWAARKDLVPGIYTEADNEHYWK